MIYYKLAWKGLTVTGWSDWQIVYVPYHPYAEDIQDAIRKLRLWIERHTYEQNAVRRARLEEEPKRGDIRI